MTDREDLNASKPPPTEPVHSLKLFDIAKAEGRPLYTSAPMVRYSKLAFRETVREYGIDLCWTPMILAKEFNRNAVARDSDFTTSPTDTPLILQFGANSPLEVSRATTLVSPFVSGVDLNCGCPQSWACSECLGAALMDKPQLTSELIKSMKAALPPGSNKTVSAKIRIHPDLRHTTDLITLLESSGISFLTIHARTKSTPSTQPSNLSALAILKSHATVPVIANGDVFSLSDAQQIHEFTSVDGVMAARGILENPGMFSRKGVGMEKEELEDEGCTWSIVSTFLNNVIKAPLPFKLVLHHISEMTSNSPNTPVLALPELHQNPGLNQTQRGDLKFKRKRKALLTKKERGEMMGLRNMIELIDWLDVKIGEKCGGGGIRRDGDGYLKGLG